MSKDRKVIVVRLEHAAVAALAVLLAPLAFLVTLEFLALSGLLDRLARRVPPDRRGREEPPEASEHPAPSDPPGRQAHQALPANVVPLVRQEYPDPWEIADREAASDPRAHGATSDREARRAHPVFRDL